MRRLLTVSLLAVVLGVSYGGALATVHTVVMNAGSFDPPALTAALGDAVRWVNNSFIQHTSTSGTGRANGIWDSPVLDPGQEFTFTFTGVGTYPYFCRFHYLSGMTGVITVTQPVPVEQTTWGRIKSLYGL
ncbi:MAG: plastocyanin/azurin family copper-binding protein [Candidatus Krumholzibacteria bacterium]|nr:plastocyanin/azurin family copper-binding protein [Candidatus Krumholzibacteria bacterium]